jgi:micrococcal nuclease
MSIPNLVTRAVMLALSTFVLGTIVGAYLYARNEEQIVEWRAWACSQGPLQVERDVDGDTIRVFTHCGTKGKAVRLLGINTPETHDPHKGVECYGPEAAEYARKLLEGKVAHLVFDDDKGVTDDHERLLAYVYLYGGYWSYIFGSGTEMNLEMIQKGYAEEWTYRGRYARQVEYRAAEAKAKAAKVGGWAQCADFKKHP